MKPVCAPVGVDLDNTIIRYDLAFHRAASERGWIDPATDATKSAVKAAIFQKFGNPEWTELQGYVYGPGLEAATPYPDAVGFFQECAGREIPTVIISHKTRYATAGPRYDLRESASQWLEASGLLALVGEGVQGNRVIFTDTRVAKLDAVRSLGCGTLIDDLPEVFREPSYPNDVRFLLFDPDGAHEDWTATQRASSWREINSLVFQ